MYIKLLKKVNKANLISFKLSFLHGLKQMKWCNIKLFESYKTIPTISTTKNNDAQNFLILNIMAAARNKLLNVLLNALKLKKFQINF